MSASQEIIPATKAPSLVTKFAERFGVEANKLVSTLKATCFKGDVTNEQLMALLIVADQHGLNPWTKEIHAFDDRRGGIVPVVGVDGWARLINEHPQFDGMDFEQDDEKCTCRMYRKDRKHPTVVTEYMAECKRPNAGPWASHPKRMLRHKAMIQCARLAFSFAGVYDQDEAERIIEATAVDVTPVAEMPDGIAEGTKEKRIGATKLRETVENITKFTENRDADSLMKLWRSFDQEQQLYVWGHLRPWEKRVFKELEAVSRKATGIGDLPSFSIELLKSCNTAAELDAAWRKIQDAFTEADQEIPDNVATTCDEMRSSMGVN